MARGTRSMARARSHRLWDGERPPGDCEAGRRHRATGAGVVRHGDHAAAKPIRWRRPASRMRSVSSCDSMRPCMMKSARSGSSCSGRPTPSKSAMVRRRAASMISSRCCARPLGSRRRHRHRARRPMARRRRTSIRCRRTSDSPSIATTRASISAQRYACGRPSCVRSGTRSSPRADAAAARRRQRPRRPRRVCCSRDSTSRSRLMVALMRQHQLPSSRTTGRFLRTCACSRSG